MPELLHLLVPQLTTLPPEIWTASIGPELRRQPKLYESIPDFPDNFIDAVLAGVTQYLEKTHDPDNILAALDRSDILAQVGALVRPPRNNVDIALRDRVISDLNKQSIDTAAFDPSAPEFQNYVGIIGELDRVLRQTGGNQQADLRQQMQDMPDDMLAAAGLNQIFTNQEGAERMNFQDPERGWQDLRDAINSMRKKARTHPVVAVPEYFYQKEATGPNGSLIIDPNIFIPGSRVIKPEILHRPEQVVMRKAGVFQSVPITERELLNTPESLRRVVHKLQTVDYVLYLLNGDSSSQVYARILPAFLKEEGLEAGTFVKLLADAYQHATQYYKAAANMSSDKQFPELARVALDAIGIGAITTLARTPLVFDVVGTNNQRMIISTETGPGIIADVFNGDYGQWRKDADGLNLFTTSSNQEPRPYNALSAEERKKAIPVFYPEDDPLRQGRVIHAQSWYTDTPVLREEAGADPYFSYIKSRLKRQLVSADDWGKIFGPRAIFFDNGRPLTIKSPKVANRINEANGDISAGVDYMLAHVLFSSHGAEIMVGMGLSSQLDRARRGDLLLVADFVPEGDIAAALRAAHARKYQNAPGPLIRFLHQHHKEIEYWKATSTDPLIIALDGKKHYHAVWRNPLNPELSPEITPIQFRNETNADGSPVTIKQKIAELDKKIEEFVKENKPKGISDKNWEIKWNSLMSQNPDIANDYKLLEKLKRGDNIIRATLYARNEWGFDPTMRNLASAIVFAGNKALDASTPQEKARWLSIQRNISDQALKTYLDMSLQGNLAPSGYRRSAQEIYPILIALAEMGPDSSSGNDPATDLEDFNLTGTLRSFGWQIDEEEREAGYGLQALFRATAMRNSATSMAYNVDKLNGKYQEKYPGMAAEYGKQLLGAVVTVNNAIESMLFEYGITRPDKLPGWNADAFDEFLVKSTINWLMSGTRGEGDKQNYIKQLVEMFGQTIPNGHSYLALDEQNNQFANLLRQLMAVAGATISTNLVLKNPFFGVEHGEEMASLAQPLATLEFNPKDSQTEQSLRKAGFGTNYPHKVTGKHPYPSMGMEGLDATRVTVDISGKIHANNREVETYGAYGHQGAETFMLTLIMMFAKDGMKMTKYKEAHIMQSLGIEKKRFEKIVETIREKMSTIADQTINSVPE